MMIEHLLVFLLSVNVACQIAYGQTLIHTFTTKENNKVELSYAFTKTNALTKDEKQAVLDMTNAVRNKIAKGKEMNTPTKSSPVATNMLAVEWDDVLEKFAQDYANTCPGPVHNDLDKFKHSNYTRSNTAENLSGDVASIYRDMYGEVKWWNYGTQKCDKNQECGHYLNIVSWAFLRMGCGFSVCKKGVRTFQKMLVCNFAGYKSSGISVEDESKRGRHDFEYWTNLKRTTAVTYAKTEPCSECPQGWDFCLGGGLCATKAECESDPYNECVCKIDPFICEGNGGRFDGANCRCKCPPSRYGRNCAHKCENMNAVMECGMTCGSPTTPPAAVEIFLCHKACGDCGKSVSTAYTYYMTNRKTRNKDKLRVRSTPPRPSTYIPQDVVTSQLPNRGNCKNKEADYFCENIRGRNYCNDVLDSKRWRYYCQASCNSCGDKRYISTKDKGVAMTEEEKKLTGRTDVKAEVVSEKDSGWIVGDNKIDDWPPEPEEGQEK